MGIVLTGIVAAVVIAVGAGIFLRSEQKEAWQVYSTQSTRVGDPGHNLVGQNWTGNPGQDGVVVEDFRRRRHEGSEKRSSYLNVMVISD